MKTLIRGTLIVLAAALVLAESQRAEAQNRRSSSQTSEYNTFESLNNGRRDFRNAMIAKQGYEPNPSSYGYVDVSDEKSLSATSQQSPETAESNKPAIAKTI